MTQCSIVIPAHNHAAVTRRCLQTLLQAPPTVEHEIIVIDDASTDSTPEVVEAFGDVITFIRRQTNGGFAAACNEGADAATGRYVLFLNNDTEPLEGWLDALVADLVSHPRAAVVGAKLLYPDGTVQHAGVVICQDGWPRHLYQGFEADHPATNRSRAFRAVTAACMLVDRDAFVAAGGFDCAYRNGLEDVDLCLRLGSLGYEVRYCHHSVLVHHESVSRGRRSKDIDAGARLYRERWTDSVAADDIDYYVQDGLLRLQYDDAFPLRLAVEPELAVLSGDRMASVERRLDQTSRQVFDLLRETVRLTVQRDEDALPEGTERFRNVRCDGDLLDRAHQLELEIAQIQVELANGGGPSASPYLVNRLLQDQVRAAVNRVTPIDSSVLVISRGDERLVDLPNRCGWHFPQIEDGTYAGHHPSSSDDAIDELEALQVRGASYLVVPEPSLWWLDYYLGFAHHLTTTCDLVFDGSGGRIFDLGGAR